MKRFIILYSLIFLFLSCSEKKELDRFKKETILASDLSENELAIKHCGSYHTFVSPELLPKTNWKNDGKFNFQQSYFYQLNSAYKEILRDFNLDGELDIAAISYFPDYSNYQKESINYFENKGNLEFKDYSFPEATTGRWIVMDARDIDSDGDIDLVLGSFVYLKLEEIQPDEAKNGSQPDRLLWNWRTPLGNFLPKPIA